MGVRLSFHPIFSSWTPKYRVKVTPEKMRFFWRGVWESFFLSMILPLVWESRLPRVGSDRKDAGARARARTSNEQLPRPERYTYKLLLLLCGKCDGFKHHAWWTPSLSSEAAKARVEVSWPVAYLRVGVGGGDIATLMNGRRPDPLDAVSVCNGVIFSRRRPNSWSWNNFTS